MSLRRCCRTWPSGPGADGMLLLGLLPLLPWGSCCRGPVHTDAWRTCTPLHGKHQAVRPELQRPFFLPQLPLCSCLVYDLGSRNKKRGAPRAVWYGERQRSLWSTCDHAHMLP